MNKIILEDLYRYEGERCKKLSCKLRYLFGTPGFTMVYLIRKVSLAKWKISKLFWMLLWHICKVQTGIQIHPSTKIGRGFRIVHFGTIVVNPGTVIGDNFNISQGTVIGYAAGKKPGNPVIGNNVCMNANSIIVGGVTIGNNVLIAPGAFINFDVPDNSIVIGNPGKIIQRDESPTSKYIVYPLK